jgi:predicted amidohydrolase YtcJ
MKQHRHWLLLLCGMGIAVGVPHPAADLILFNGRFLTMDPTRPEVQAVAVQGEQIVAVGTDRDVAPYRGPHTRVVDLHGRFAMPGFNDAHTHLAAGGLALLQVDLTGARSLAEMQQRIRAALPRYAPGQWIVGRGWDHTLWPEKRFPNRGDLDAVSTDHPMFFMRVDGHIGVANSRALMISGIEARTPDPPGGRIVRDAQGRPTGLLEEKATDLVERQIPPPGPAEHRRAIELAIAEAHRNGVTSVSDFSSWDEFQLYRQLKAEGRLTLRITEWLPFELPLERLERMRREGGSQDRWLRTGALKGFLDGTFGSETAAMLAPYSDHPEETGILRMNPQEVIAQTIERDRAGFQIAFHAIGDRAVRLALDAFAAAAAANGPRDRRDRIEHAQVVAPEDFGRFARLGVIASVQPCHLLDDVRWAEQRLGPERSRYGYPWKSFLQHNVRLAIGTDFPVEPINPMGNLYACRTRQTREGWPPGGWQPQERISMEDCLRAYTVGAAYAEFAESWKGQLRPGMVADIVVLSDDPRAVAPAALWQVHPLLTIVGGRIVYQSPEAHPLFQ